MNDSRDKDATGADDALARLTKMPMRWTGIVTPLEGAGGFVAYGEFLTRMREAAAIVEASRREVERLRSAADRARYCIRLLIAHKPVRDVTETLAELDAALSAQGQQEPTGDSSDDTRN